MKSLMKFWVRINRDLPLLLSTKMNINGKLVDIEIDYANLDHPILKMEFNPITYSWFHE